MIELLTEKAPGLLTALGIEDEDDLGLALVFWCVFHLKAGSYPEELAKLN